MQKLAYKNVDANGFIAAFKTLQVIKSPYLAFGSINIEGLYT